jgi:hypothetical protein
VEECRAQLKNKQTNNGVLYSRCVSPIHAFFFHFVSFNVFFFTALFFLLWTSLHSSVVFSCKFRCHSKLLDCN